MSGKATGMVWELDIPHNQQFVLLAMADHADHNGGHIFPSVAEIAWKTGYSERQTRRIISEMRKSKILELTKEHYGKYGTNCYRILWDNAPKKTPIPDKMTGGQNVTPDKKASPPDIQMSYNPSYDPSEESKDSLESAIAVPVEVPPKSHRKPDPVFDWVAANIFKVKPEAAHDDADTNKWIGANAAKLVNAEKKLLGIPKSKPLTDDARLLLAAQLPGLLKFYNQQSPGLSPPQAKPKFGVLVTQWYGAGKPFSNMLQILKYVPVEHDDYVSPGEAV